MCLVNWQTYCNCPRHFKLQREDTVYMFIEILFKGYNWGSSQIKWLMPGAHVNIINIFTFRNCDLGWELFHWHSSHNFLYLCKDFWPITNQSWQKHIVGRSCCTNLDACVVSGLDLFFLLRGGELAPSFFFITAGFVLLHFLLFLSKDL